MYKKYIKRTLDIILSLIGLLILLPFFVIFSVIIKLESKGPVFFKQKRIGKDKKTFYIYKFRTMRIDTPRDMPTHMLSNADSYITKFGKFMRKTSIDELPQLINILKGDMSIIGPRPALWNQEDLIKERDKYNENPIPLKAKYDGEYIEKISFWFDIKIFLKTIVKVFKHDGIVEGKQKQENEKEKINVK